VEHAARPYPLRRDVGLLVPVAPEVRQLELLLDAAAATTLEVELWSTGRAENYVPHRLEVRGEVRVEAGERQWVAVPLAWTPETAQNGFLVVKTNEALTLYLSDRPQTGVLVFEKGDKPRVSASLEDHDIEQPVVQWSMKGGLVRTPFCFRLSPETSAFAAGKTLDGYVRPYGEPHLWVSAPLRDGEEATLEYAWDAQPVEMREVHLTFNDDVNEDLINLHHHRTPFDVIPELVKDYRLEAEVDGQWVPLLRVVGNRKRKRVHRLEQPVTAAKLLLTVERTNGGASAELFELRVYG
jgi:hypothetical protein